MNYLVILKLNLTNFCMDDSDFEKFLEIISENKTIK
jgi:hypothetical protein